MENQKTNGNRVAEAALFPLETEGFRSAKVLACEEPGARLETHGAAALSDVELLAIVLGGGAEKALAAAREALAAGGNLCGVARWTLSDASAVVMSEGAARRVAASFEIARRMVAERAALVPAMLNRPELIAQEMAARTLGLQVEKFWVLSLNRKNRLIACDEITSGTATSSLAHPREVFRAAVRRGACAVVCVHNHPSGDPAPSAADVQVTRQLREAARALDIELLDHVVMGEATLDPRGRGFYSFREAGVL